MVFVGQIKPYPCPRTEGSTLRTHPTRSADRLARSVVGGRVVVVILALAAVAVVAPTAGVAKKAHQVTSHCSLQSMFSADEVLHGNGKKYIDVPHPTVVENLEAKTARVTATARVKRAFRKVVRLCPSSRAFIITDEVDKPVVMKLSRDKLSAKAVYTRSLHDRDSVVVTGRRVRGG